MNDIKRYIDNDLKPLALQDLVIYAQNISRNYKFSHIPVVENGVFMGTLLAEDIEEAEANQKISDFSYTLEPFFVLNTTNWFEVLQKFSKHDANLVPVLNQNNQYIGYYNLIDVVKVFTESPFLSEEGNTIIVEKNQAALSFSEITQIVESNNAKLLGLFINNINDNIVQVTVKTTPTDINAVLRTFRRYDYDIVSEHMDDAYINNLKNRSDYLDKYLNI